MSFNFMATVTICSDFGAQENKTSHCFPSICHEVMGLDAFVLVFWMFSFKPAFSLSSFTLQFFTFCHKGGVICLSEVIDISPSNLDSSLCFIQPGISHDAYKLNKESDNIQPWRTPFPVWDQSIVSCLVLTVASWPVYRFLRRQVKWSGIPI